MTVSLNPAVNGVPPDAGTSGGLASLPGGITKAAWATIPASGGVSLVFPSIATRMIMACGQSLSIGTRNTALSFPQPPTQPELASKFVAFNNVGSTGRSTTAIVDADTTSFVPYQELTGNSGGLGYYTHGTGFFRYVNSIGGASQQWLWAPAGIGGQTITALDLAGGTVAYANQQKMLSRAALIDASTDVTAILFDQGEANWADSTPDTYLTKLITYKTNQLAAVTAVFPSSTPKFLITQCGDGSTSIRVHVAQAAATRAGNVICAGPKYWLNRNYPNIPGNEQLHLNVNGYTYQGEMFARALASEMAGVPFKPTMLYSIEYVDSTTIKIKCNTPNGGGLTIDTSTLPQAPGYGIDIQKPNLNQLVPTNVYTKDNDIYCQFGETLYPDFRVRIGYSLTDITQDGTASGNYLQCANIRGRIGNKSKSGLPDWYDWIMTDRYVLGKIEPGYIAPGVLGTELWRTDKYGLTDGLITSAVFDGTNMVLTRNGITNAPTTTVGFIDGGISVDGLYWAIKTGKTYRVTATCQVTSGAGAHEIRIYVGNTIIKRTSLNSGTLGTFTQDVTAVADGILTCQLNNVATVGQISNISVKEVL